MEKGMSKEEISVKIPKALHDHIEGLIRESGFRTVEEFIVFVLRDVVYDNTEQKSGDLTPYELRRIKDKLRLLGYL